MVRLFVQVAVARGQILVMDEIEMSLFENGSRTVEIEIRNVPAKLYAGRENLSHGDLVDQTEQDRRCLMSA